MRELRGRVAVVTGGGSGIGAALARACAAAGMRVVVADVDCAAAGSARREIQEAGGEAISVTVDVRRREALEALAERTWAAYGACHLLCNNAGVALFRPAAETTAHDWAWVLGVNLEGVLHGVSAFLPRLRAQGGEAHIVNTASMAGLVPIGELPIAAYTASKYAVVGFSEMLRTELAPHGIGVSVVCPGGVATRIGESERVRPAELRDAVSPEERPLDATREGILPPEVVAARVLDAVRADELYVITHPEWWPAVEARSEALRRAFLAARKS